jgi:STE24 endopeptidase
MRPEITLLIIITIVVVSYLFDQLLDYLNLKAQRNDIPPEIESFYDKEKYLKSLEYQKTQARFSFLTSGFSFLLSLALLILVASAGLMDYYVLLSPMKFYWHSLSSERS